MHFDLEFTTGAVRRAPRTTPAFTWNTPSPRTARSGAAVLRIHPGGGKMEGAMVTPVQMMGQSWHRGGLFTGMHWIWWLFWVATLAILVWAFWRLFSDEPRERKTVRREEAAEAELRVRYARGEIDEEEYAERLHVLRTTIGE